MGTIGSTGMKARHGVFKVLEWRSTMAKNGEVGMNGISARDVLLHVDVNVYMCVAVHGSAA